MQELSEARLVHDRVLASFHRRLIPSLQSLAIILIIVRNVIIIPIITQVHIIVPIVIRRRLDNPRTTTTTPRRSSHRHALHHLIELLLAGLPLLVLALLALALELGPVVAAELVGLVLDGGEEVVDARARHGRDADDAQVGVELLEHEAHGVQQAAHVAAAAALALDAAEGVPGLVARQRRLERVVVGHPLLREARVLHVRLVEHEHHRQLRLVEDRARVQHVAHEGAGRGRPRRVDHVGDHRREGGGQGLEEDLPRRGPHKYFDLTGWWEKVSQMVSPCG